MIELRHDGGWCKCAQIVRLSRYERKSISIEQFRRVTQHIFTRKQTEKKEKGKNNRQMRKMSISSTRDRLRSLNLNQKCFNK